MANLYDYSGMTSVEIFTQTYSHYTQRLRQGDLHGTPSNVYQLIKVNFNLRNLGNAEGYHPAIIYNNIPEKRFGAVKLTEGMAIDIKLSKFNNTPWGFRLSGGADFPHPLTVVRVARGSLADDAGLQPGDVLIRVNDSPLQNLTHAQAHDWLVRAGNNFVVSVVRNHRIAKEAH